MALPLGQTGTADPIESEYFTWKSSDHAFGDRSFQVHMHLDAINGLARDVIERSEGLPVEVGGLLLGHAGRGDRPVIWIERYQRVECEHRSGPHFILDEDEHRSLERLAVELSGSHGELSVVGFYRSHQRPGFQMEAPDFQLTDRYFKDAEDLFLLVKPVEKAGNAPELVAQFFIREHAADGSAGEIRAANPSFPFHGRLLRVLEQPSEHEQDDPRERTGKSAPVPAEPAAPHAEAPIKGASQGERLGRLVPDFVPAGEAARPAREFFMESRPMPSLLTATEDLNPSHGFLRRRWPILAAILLVGAGAAVFLQQASHRDGAASAVSSEAAIRPLGLYVNPGSEAWRISWNPAATALQGARGVQLFVHDGDEPNRIELSPADLKSGTYQYQAKAQDVTFRMEVTEANGHVSAESFRLVKSVEKVPVAAPVSAGPTKLIAIKQVAPVVPGSIRPGSRALVPVDVRVRIDAKGHVVSATPTTRAHSGLESFLEERAVAAAKQWRFEAGNEGSEIIHFTFKK